MRRIAVDVELKTICARFEFHPQGAKTSAFIPQKILTHSSSRVVLKVLESAAADKKRFTVYVTESQPDSSG